MKRLFPSLNFLCSFQPWYSEGVIVCFVEENKDTHVYELACCEPTNSVSNLQQIALDLLQTNGQIDKQELMKRASINPITLLLKYHQVPIKTLEWLKKHDSIFWHAFAQEGENNYGFWFTVKFRWDGWCHRVKNIFIREDPSEHVKHLSYDEDGTELPF